MKDLQITSSGPIVLVILDGWGIAPRGPGNAVELAKTPNMDSYWASFPHTQLSASGESVGLPKKEPGNSETGHLNIGAGRIVYQDLPRIDLAIADGSFFWREAFLKAIDHVKKNRSSLHLIGLIGSGGVHTNIEHLFALLCLATNAHLENVFLHLFTDGRDSSPTSSPIFINQVETELAQLGTGRIATIMGRYYAMDRDNRWERIQKAYEAMTLGIGKTANNPLEAIKNSYQEGKTDEFIEPTVILDANKQPVKLISDNDAVIFFNFRVDRPRELTRAFVLEDLQAVYRRKPSFDPYAEERTHHELELDQVHPLFQRKKFLNNLLFVTMTMYEKNLPVEVAFPPPKVTLSLASIFSANQKRQFHIAETEKYPHVTSFFDGMIEFPYPSEEWVEVPSPKIATYDLMPEMSAEEVTDQFLKRFKTNLYPFICLNFANPDMVGHTGVIRAGIRACEFTDFYLGKIVSEVLSQDGTIIVTADHGNIEEMINLVTGQIDTEHSSNSVPFIILNNALRGRGETLPTGILSDIAPTILGLAKISVPSEMIGRNLLA